MVFKHPKNESSYLKIELRSKQDISKINFFLKQPF